MDWFDSRVPSSGDKKKEKNKKIIKKVASLMRPELSYGEESIKRRRIGGKAWLAGCKVARRIPLHFPGGGGGGSWLV